MEINYRETLRYLGYQGRPADETVLEMIRQCWEELERVVSARAFWREYPLKVKENVVDACVFRTESRSLAKNLRGCDRILLFAASLGSGADRLIRRDEKLEMSRAVVMQAAAAAYLEDYCDGINEELRRQYEAEGRYLRPRFSPGYGDFPLACQPAVIAALEAGKRVGITLTDGLLMVPTKSVTAVIGVGRTPLSCEIKGCEACGKPDCEYSRAG